MRPRASTARGTRSTVIAVLATGLAATALTGCLGNDFSSEPLGVEKWDQGWLLAIAPDVDLGVWLLGSVGYPAAVWSVGDVDDSVVRMVSNAAEEPSATTHPDDPVESQLAATSSHFTFVGVALGSTSLRFDLVADGELIDAVEYAVDVVPDACAAETAAVANRCYDADGFGYSPQVLTELEYGTEHSIDVGSTARLVLTANALHPDAAWSITPYDDSIVSVEGPLHLAPREAGDFSDVDATVRHSFLPASEFTVTGSGAGRTDLTFDLESDGLPLDTFTITVVVPAP